MYNKLNIIVEVCAMQYEIKGGLLPVAVMTLAPGESIVTEGGGMSWMSPNMKMDTNMKGGLFGGLSRAFAGESIFLNTYTAEGGPGLIACASCFPGTILTFDLPAGQAIIAQKHSFLCSSSGVTLSMHWKRSIGVGMFGGEGFVMQKIEGPGRVFLEIDGSLEKISLASGQSIIVDPGHLAVYTPSVQVALETVKGFKNILLGGEGLFVARITGPGDIYLQTLTAQNVAGSLLPYLPKPSN
jgi:uncharacterized protein (TIGR00266 family)